MKTTILGLFLSLFIILLVILSKQNVSLFISWQSLAITLGGTLAATVTYFSAEALDFTTDVLVKLFKRKEINPMELVKIIVKTAQDIHYKDILDLIENEEIAKAPFFRKGLILIADDVNPTYIKQILIRHSQAITAQYRIAERVFAVSGSFAPMFGMLGTVIGLISMLTKINDPQEIPYSMGLALITTMYGLILSATFFIPISGKIRDMNHIQTNHRALIIEGVMAIYQKENTHIVNERLLSYLNPWDLKYEEKKR